MKSFVVAVIVVITSVFLAESSAAQTSERRQVRRGYAGRITDLVRSGEKELVVFDSMDLPLRVPPPPGTSPLEWISQLAKTIVLVEVQDRRSTLDEKQEWLTSVNTAKVVEVLKASTPERPLTEGGTFVFAEQGGTITLNGTTVKAMVPRVRSIEVGKRYLIFANIGESGEFLVAPEATYEVSPDGHLRRLGDRRKEPNDGDIENAVVSQVLERIRGVVRNPR